MSGNAVFIPAAADTFYHICRIPGKHFFRSDNTGLLSCRMIRCGFPVDIFSHLFRRTFHNGEFTPGGIMSVFHPRRLGGLSTVCPQDRGICVHRSQHRTELFPGDISGAENLRRTHRQINDRGLQSDSHFSTVDNGIDPAHHIFHDIFGHGRTRFPGSIGTGCRNISAAVLDQLLCRRM